MNKILKPRQIKRKQSQRKNFIDSNFLLIKDAEKRVDELETIYNSQFETEVIKITNRHEINYISIKKEVKPEENSYLTFSQLLSLVNI